MKNILVATTHRESVSTIFESLGSEYEIEEVHDRETCAEKIAHQKFEFLFLDIGLLLPIAEGTTLKQQLQRFWQHSPELEIIILSGQDSIRQAVYAVRAGASNYLTYPIDPAEIKLILDEIKADIRVHAELKYLRNQFWRRDAEPLLRTGSPLMSAVFDKVRAVAPTESTVLITGETGTGKGVIAKLLHEHSRRADKQFISVHCGAIPDTLLESELFGHEKGAFTGAIRRKLGKFEIANGGTIFLDEIGTISPSMQIKLLQVLQEKMFQRVGGEVSMSADVRIIVATNSDLQAMCAEGSFRRDLFYRLNVFPIEVPPLRERLEDIPPLVATFLKKLNRFSQKSIRDIEPKFLKILESYEWPGNIRELENLIERAFIIEETSVLTVSSLPVDLIPRNYLRTAQVNIDNSLKSVRQRAMETAEKNYLIELLKEHRGKINDTAEAAGIGVRQLHKLMIKHQLRKEDFRISPRP